MKKHIKDFKNISHFDRFIERRREDGTLSGRVSILAESISKEAKKNRTLPMYYIEMSKSSYEEVNDFVINLMKIIENGYSNRRDAMLTKKATRLALEYNVNYR